MILYNVTIKIDHNCSENWLKWLQETQIPAIMETGFFRGYKICKLLLEQEEPDGSTYALQLLCDSIGHLITYQKYHEDSFKTNLYEKFGGRYVLFSTTLKVVEDKLNQNYHSN